MKLLKQCMQKCFRMEWPLLVRLYDYNHRAGESVSFPMEATRHSSAYDLLYIEWYLHSQIRLSCRLCHWFLVYWSHLPSLWLVSTYTYTSKVPVQSDYYFILIFVAGRFSYHKRWLKEFIFNQTTNLQHERYGPICLTQRCSMHERAIWEKRCSYLNLAWYIYHWHMVSQYTNLYLDTSVSYTVFMV